MLCRGLIYNLHINFDSTLNLDYSNIIENLAQEKAPSLLSLVENEMSQKGYTGAKNGGYGDALNAYSKSGQAGLSRGDSGSLILYCNKNVNASEVLSQLNTEIMKSVEGYREMFQQMECLMISGTDFAGSYSEKVQILSKKYWE